MFHSNNSGSIFQKYAANYSDLLCIDPGKEYRIKTLPNKTVPV